MTKFRNIPQITLKLLVISQIQLKYTENLTRQQIIVGVYYSLLISTYSRLSLFYKNQIVYINKYLYNIVDLIKKIA